MSDSTFLRFLAGPGFRRADTTRDERASEKTHGIDHFLGNLAGIVPAKRQTRQSIRRFNDLISSVEDDLRTATDTEIIRCFQSVLQQLKSSPREQRHMAAALACVGEASHRVLNMRPYGVQFVGARILMQGLLAEMQTGEGKTLVAALAATVMAGTGASVHIVSTNDYLAQRDSKEMAPLMAFFGLRCAYIRSEMSPDQRRAAYRHDICYVSGKELVFDYLKDRIAGHGVLPMRVSQIQHLSIDAGSEMREPLIPALHFAIVDEADSVLIDEARTPMIISRESPGLYEPGLLRWAIEAARSLKNGVHFRSEAQGAIELISGVLDQCPPLPADVRRVWRSSRWRELLLRQALTALHLFVRDQHYIVTDGKVQIVDESTGRLMPDRSWEQGLHQMIEAKEDVEFTKGRETVARMTFQRFFRRYFLVAGLTGTAAEASRELWSVYRLAVRRIPPHRPSRRRMLPSRCVSGLSEKWRLVADDASVAAIRGQAVLVGTRSVEASEQISAELFRRGIAHQVLNARQDAQEAEVIAQAGDSGRITVATNMAGRGTDIKPSRRTLDAGGLHVILTEFHESTRVDRQLFGRTGRQGNPGTACAIVSANDSIFSHQPALMRFFVSRLRGFPQRVLLRVLLFAAQGNAESRAYRVRMETLRQDRNLARLIGFAGRVT